MNYEPKNGADRITLPLEEYIKHFDPYLTAMGIRSKIVGFKDTDVVIMSENLYRDTNKEAADHLMTNEELTRYKLESI